MISRMHETSQHDDRSAVGGAEEVDPEQIPTAGANANVLLLDECLDPGARDLAGRPFSVLDFAADQASLIMKAEEEPALVQVGANEECASAPTFATVRGASGERLVMLTAPGSRVRVNGLPAPIVASLSLGDQLQTDGGHLFHVSRKMQTDPIPPPVRLIGKPCEVCLVPFAAESRVLLCPACGAARHMEGEDVDPEERLECGALGACPNCQNEWPESGELAFVPED
jgi:hypothetical protein